jgi:hypothetical protein
VVFNGENLAGADESLPLTTACPSPYPLTKAIAEREVLAAHSPGLSTVALRPHLIWGVGDPHLVPRILSRARAGRLRIVGDPVLEIELQKRLERRQLHPLLVGKRAIHDTDPGRTAGADGRGLLGERRLGGGKRRGGNRRGDEECRSGE